MSKIPKLTFGSKRSAQQTTNIPSRESTPVQCHDDRGKVKSTPVSSSSSSVGRSKSLKLPRKQYVRGPLASNSSSRLESARQLRGIYIIQHRADTFPSTPCSFFLCPFALYIISLSFSTTHSVSSIPSHFPRCLAFLSLSLSPSSLDDHFPSFSTLLLYFSLYFVFAHPSPSLSPSLPPSLPSFLPSSQVPMGH